MHSKYLLIPLLASVHLSSCATSPQREVSQKPNERTPAQTAPIPYSGGSDYKLFLGASPDVDFDPGADITQLSERDLAREQVRNTIRGALLKSTFPVMGVLTGNKTGTEPNVLTSLLNMTSILQQTLRFELSQIEVGDQSIWPLAQEIVLTPWLDKKDNLFYGVDKISMDSAHLVNVLGVTPSSLGFDKKLTTAVQEFQKRSTGNLTDPAYLLGFSGHLHLDPKRESLLTLRVLLGLKPERMKFEKINDQVKLEQLVIPETDHGGPVAALTFNIGLSPNSAAPTLDITFGEFDKFEDGSFVILATNQEKSTPRLVGTLNKNGLKWIATHFAFKKMTLDLEQKHLSDLEMLTSAGINIGGAQFTVGGFSVQSVDQQFQAEINNTIDAEVKKAIRTGKDKIESGILEKQMIELAFGKIFGERT